MKFRIVKYEYADPKMPYRFAVQQWQPHMIFGGEWVTVKLSDGGYFYYYLKDAKEHYNNLVELDGSIKTTVVQSSAD